MKTKNLQNLMIKHFNFLQKDYGFKYDSLFKSYVRFELKIEVEHKNGELNLFVFVEDKKFFLIDYINEVLKKYFTYPAHFSSLVFSMGDVDSRLAYDAKLMKKYAKDIL